MRLSVDQKQVLLHRNAEDERHLLQSVLTSSSDVDNNDDIPQQSSQPSRDNVHSTEKDVEPMSSHGNNNPTVIPDHGMYR